MSTLFQTKIINNVGTAPTTAVTAPSNGTVTVLGLSLANLTNDNIYASVKVADNLSNSAYYAYNLLVPPNSSLRVLNGGERLTLASQYSLTVSASEDNGFDAVISYVVIQ